MSVRVAANQNAFLCVAKICQTTRASLASSNENSHSQLHQAVTDVSKKSRNLEDAEAETAMESHLPAFMAEINRRFDALQASLASKEDIDKIKAEFKMTINSLTTTSQKKTVWKSERQK